MFFMNETRKKIVGAVAGVVLGAGFILLCPDVGLEPQGVRCLGILLGAVVWWVMGVLPEYATGFVMVVLLSVVGGVSTTVSLSGFVTETWWLLVAAFGLGAGMKLSGLMKRMAYAIVRAFPNTFAAQAAGLIAASSVIGPLVPSLAAKAAMLEPVALNIGQVLGYERYGKPMQGLFLAVFTGIRNIGLAAISASILGYAFLATFPADVQAQFDMVHWFISALPWFLLVTIANYIAIVVLYQPRDSKKKAIQNGSGQQDEPENTTAANNARPAPSPMSRHEKQMCVIILTTVALWALQPLHGIAPHIVGLAAFACTVACGIMGKRGLREAVGWESLIFIGTAFGLASVFAEAGIQEWVVNLAGPAFEALAGNPYLFVLGIGLITVALRFLIVSEVACLNIVMAFLVPLAMHLGINPWVVGFSMYACLSPWFVIYQNSVYLAALYSVDGEMVHHTDIAKYCFLYTAICLAALAASVPYWQWMGLM